MGLLRDSVKGAIDAFITPQGHSVAQTIPTWESDTPRQPPTLYDRFAREGYMRSEVVYACVEQLATSVAEPKIRAYQRNSDPEGEPIEIKQHPILDLLERPNPFCSGKMFWQNAMMYRAVAGNGFVEKARAKSKTPVELWWWRPDRARIIPNKETFIGGYQLDVAGQQFTLPPKDIIHFKNRAPMDDYYGMPPIQVISSRIDTDNYMREFTRLFFTNAGVPSGMLTMQQKISPENREMLRARFRSEYAGPQGWHNLLVLDQTVATYTQMGLGMGAAGLAVPELNDINESRIAMAFGVPLSLIGARLGMQSSSYANRVADQKSFWEITLIPIYQEFAAVLNSQLVPEFTGVDYIEFDLSSVHALEEDRNEYHARVRADMLAQVIGRQQARKLLNYGEPDDDDVYIVSTNTTTEPVKPPEIEPQFDSQTGNVIPGSAAETAQQQAQAAAKEAARQIQVNQVPQIGGPKDATLPADSAQQTTAPAAAKPAMKAAAFLEIKTIDGVKYACLMASLPATVARKVRMLAADVDDDDLAGNGRVTDPHVTIKYGITTNTVSDVTDAIADFGASTLSLTFGSSTFFPSKDGIGPDVVILPVSSTDCARLNALVSKNLPHVDTFSGYTPHVTIAYVKPGKGVDYVGLDDLDGKTASVDTLLFSDSVDRDTSIALESAVKLLAVAR